jgi:hypothetical protein
MTWRIPLPGVGWLHDKRSKLLAVLLHCCSLAKDCGLGLLATATYIPWSHKGFDASALCVALRTCRLVLGARLQQLTVLGSSGGAQGTYVGLWVDGCFHLEQRSSPLQGLRVMTTHDVSPEV